MISQAPSSDQHGATQRPILYTKQSLDSFYSNDTSAASTPWGAFSNSSRDSPFSTPSQTDTNMSLQTTPEVLTPMSPPKHSIPTTISLPDSMCFPPTPSPATSSPSIISETNAPSKGPGLLRRISQSARFRRRRGSTSNSHRDQSCGPSIYRRRSDSRGIADNTDVSDMELERHEEEEYCEATMSVSSLMGSGTGLGITGGHSSPGLPLEVPADGPALSLTMQQGVEMLKCTKKRHRPTVFRIDQDSAKVMWQARASRSDKQFSIDAIESLKTGEDARHYMTECHVDPEQESRFFSIIYICDNNTFRSGTRKQLNVIAPTASLFEMWTGWLNNASRKRFKLMKDLVGTAEAGARTLWRSTMDRRLEKAGYVEQEERLDFKEALKLCRSLYINATENEIKARFAKADTDGSGFLNQDQFLVFVRFLKERSDIKDIHRRSTASGQQELDRDSFLRFLVIEQKVDVQSNLDYWYNIFEKYATSPHYRGDAGLSFADGPVAEPTMSVSAFQAFLTSSANAVLPPLPSNVKLDRPLNEYFISSSHNTYLLGRQVYGESSIEAYIDALLKGCRCIEIDCWNGSNGRPIVVHGRTFTSHVPFSDCIDVINKYAFVSSPYPLVISLEVHTDDHQQNVMTEIMKRVFGDALLTQPIDDTMTLPSPEQLKGKILIKVKAAQETMEPIRRGRSTSSPWSRPVQLDNSVIPNSPLGASSTSISPAEIAAPFWASPRTSATSHATMPTAPASSEDDDSTRSIASEKKKTRAKTSKIISVLGELGVYCQGAKHDPEWSNASFNHIFSFAEGTFDKISEDPRDRDPGYGKRKIEAHNMQHLMRVYPAPKRIDSSNFDPVKFWRRGVQFVALNWQTYDLGMHINDAMFAAGSDRTGYVLKPDELRYGRDDVLERLSGDAKKPPKKQVSFSVDILSAQQLPRPRNMREGATMNPFVEFEMFFAEDKSRGIASGTGGVEGSARNGMSGIGQPLRKYTRACPNNGFDPSWNDKLTLSLETRYPSLVFVRLTVWNSSNPHKEKYSTSGASKLGSFTGKLSSLQEGYRHLPLYNENGDKFLFSTLFCKIKKNAHVEITTSEPASVERENGRGMLSRVFSRRNSQNKRRELKHRTGSEPVITRSSTMESSASSAINC